MDIKPSREERLVQLLFQEQDYLTAEVLAKMLDSSTKTVYRLVKKINEASGDNPLIHSEKGRGFKLNYENYVLNQTQGFTKIDITPAARRKEIMERLLLISPRSENIYDLFSSYWVGESVISTDEKFIAAQVKNYDLVLERKNRTLTILGSEKNIRRAITDLIQELNIIDLEMLKNIPGEKFKPQETFFLLKQLQFIEKELDSTIPYPYNINLFTHLYILINRFQVSRIICETPELTDLEKQQLDKSEELYTVAAQVIKNVENYLHANLSENEIFYLYQYLLSSRMKGTTAFPIAFSEQVMKITQEYLLEMSERLKMSNIKSTDHTDLACHIKPLLNRLAYGVKVKNGLLDQIQNTYQQIFEEVRKVSEKISEKYDLPKINLDEVGFLTLYFAKIIETNPIPIKTVIMCMTGVGTSELLRAKVLKNFPELEIVEVTTVRYSEKELAEHPEIELILTTVNLPKVLPVPTLVVNAFLTDEDKKRIQKKIEEIYHA